MMFQLSCNFFVNAELPLSFALQQTLSAVDKFHGRKFRKGLGPSALLGDGATREYLALFSLEEGS